MALTLGWLIAMHSIGCTQRAGFNKPAPVTVSLTAAATNLPYGASTVVTWSSTHSTSCSSSGGGGSGTAGSFNTGALTTTTTYSVTCVGTVGSATKSITVTVSPAIPTYTLSVTNSGGGTVSSSPAGIDCGTSCSATFTSGTAVTLTAAASGGYSFTGWSGACSGAGSCVVTLAADTDLAATFALIVNPISLSLVAARSSGVAPLAVFFDASGTTDATVTSRPFHDLEYRWDFGDPAGSPVSGTTWGAGSGAGVNDRNFATGPVASHVFETPGIYTVTVTAFDGTNTAATDTTITVQNPNVVFVGDNTTCFSTSGTFTGCPAGATQVTTSSFATAVSTYQASGKRLLFRRGETFVAASAARINTTGPGIVGAFGTGAAPVVQMTGNATVLVISSSTTPTLKDWRVMDLEVDGSSGDNTIAVSADGGFNQMLGLRLNVHDAFRGVSAGPSILDWYNNNGNPGHAIYEDWAVVDSTITPMPNGCVTCGWSIAVAGLRTSIQGNISGSALTGGPERIRGACLTKSVIANNSVAGGADNEVWLFGVDWTTAGVCNPGGVGTYAEQIIMADNKMTGGSSAWMVRVTPENGGDDARLRDMIVERNWFISGAGTQMAVNSDAAESTFRNNIFDTTADIYHGCLAVNQWGSAPAPYGHRIYHNTFYSGAAGDFKAVS
ncbi:MAG: PKD domain-containing protein, partial [Myxococcota bacterium]